MSGSSPEDEVKPFEDSSFFSGEDLFKDSLLIGVLKSSTLDFRVLDFSTLVSS